MIPKFSTFFSIRHIAGKKVHYHCKIPKGYNHIKIDSAGNDGVFRKNYGENESVISLKSRRKTIDIGERKSIFLTPQSDDVEIALVGEGRYFVNEVEFYYLKATKHIRDKFDIRMILFLHRHNDYHIEIMCSAKTGIFEENVEEYFDFIDTIEIHEKG